MQSAECRVQSAELCCPCIHATRLGQGRATSLHLHCTPNNPNPHPHPPAGPVRDPTDSRVASPLHVAQLSAPEFTAPVAPYRRAQLVHGGSYSILRRPGASSVGNIPCLARLSHGIGIGIGSAIPANSTCCSSCSFPDSCDLEPASRLSPSATRSSSSYQVSHVACILHLASGIFI
jgi:hypothetical protein